MNRIFKITLVGLAMQVGSLSLMAQNFQERMENLRAGYGNTNKLHVEMVIHIYENEQQRTPVHTEHASLKRNGSLYQYKYSSMEMLMNDKYTILVNLPERMISFTKRDVKGEEKFFKQPTSFDLDSILGLYEAPALVKVQGELEHYRVRQKEGPVKTVDLYIDTRHNKLTRMDYVEQEGAYTVIEFKVLDTTPEFDENEFKESNYILAAKGTVKPSPRFSGYRIIAN